jgi:hypothetical protein
MKKKKKTVQLGRDTNHRAADNRMISKMPAIYSQNTIVHPQTQKKKTKKSCFHCQSPTPTSANLPCWLMNQTTRLGLSDVHRMKNGKSGIQFSEFPNPSFTPHGRLW